MTSLITDITVSTSFATECQWGAGVCELASWMAYIRHEHDNLEEPGVHLPPAPSTALPFAPRTPHQCVDSCVNTGSGTSFRGHAAVQ
jgi:hypothetical protein